jgi:hypothetical protein
MITLARSILFAASTVASAAVASERSPVDELVAAMKGHTLSEAELGVQLIDCPTLGYQQYYPPDLISRFHDSRQWLINGPYEWIMVRYPGGTCVHVHSGDGSSGHGLTSMQARALLSASKLDLADRSHASEQQAFNCHVRRRGDYGGYIPRYDEGTLGGHRYRIFHAGLAADLAPIDAVQRRFAEEQKQRLARSPATDTPPTPDAFELDIRFGTGMRTRELATLYAYIGNPMIPRAVMSWMLHLPSGRLVTFDDLFVDPGAVRERIVRKYLDFLPEYMANSIPQVSEEQMSEDIGPITQVALAYETTRRYFETARKLLTPPPRLIEVGMGPSDKDRAFFGGRFDVEVPANFHLPLWSAAAEDVDGAFKPEFRAVLDLQPCPPMPEGW